MGLLHPPSRRLCLPCLRQHPPPGAAKLSDFGLARLRSTVVATADPEAGTAGYTAPECFDVDNYHILHKGGLSSAVLRRESRRRALRVKQLRPGRAHVVHSSLRTAAVPLALHT